MHAFIACYFLSLSVPQYLQRISFDKMSTLVTFFPQKNTTQLSLNNKDKISLYIVGWLQKKLCTCQYVSIAFHVLQFNWKHWAISIWREQLSDDLFESTSAQRVNDRTTRAGQIRAEKGEVFQPRNCDISSQANTKRHCRHEANEVSHHDDNNVPSGLNFFFSEEVQHFSALRSAFISTS